MSKCGSCRWFLGGGDFSLCCSIDSWLHYEDSDGCEKYELAELRTCYCPLCHKHFEVRSNDSMGDCPDCSHHVVLHTMEVDDE